MENKKEQENKEFDKEFFERNAVLMEQEKQHRRNWKYIIRITEGNLKMVNLSGLLAFLKAAPDGYTFEITKTK